MKFLDRVSKILKLNFMKFRPVGVELFHVGRQTDRYDEANSRISKLSKRASKMFMSLLNLAQNSFRFRQSFVVIK
jgi:hypothetical protein